MSQTDQESRTTPVHLEIDALTRILVERFVAAGLTEVEAARIADALCDAEKCGVATHGLLRVPWYLDALGAGTVAPYRQLPPIADNEAVAVLDGGGAYGYQPMWEATEAAAEKARRFGVGLALVRRCSEFGRAAYYVRELARQGLIGVACQNTTPQIAAPGTETVVVGNSPLAFAAPGEHGASFDGAFTPRSGGELLRRRLLGLPLPLEWGYRDSDGEPTTDPEAAFSTAQQAAGGIKGFGVALLVETLAGALSGSEHGPVPAPGAPTVGAMVLAIDPGAAAVQPEEFDAGNRTMHDAVIAAGGTWPGSRSLGAQAEADARGTVIVARGIVDACREAVGESLDEAVRS